MRNSIIVTTLTIVLIFLYAVDAAAQTRRRIRFGKGASSASVSGVIKGYAYRDYVIGAREGQTLSVALSGSSAADLAIFMPDGGNLGADSTGVADWTGELPASGDYVVRILMPRSAARRKGAAARFALRITIE
jgi:hypothetical protein